MHPWRFPTGVPTASGLLIGFALSSRIPDPVALIGGIPASLLLLILRRRQAGNGPVPLLLCLGISVAAGVLRADPPLAFPFRENAKIAGRVTAWEPTPYGPAIRVVAYRLGARSLTPPRPLRISGREGWGDFPGSGWLRVEGRLEPERGATNPGGRKGWGGGRLRPSREARPEWGPGGTPVFLGSRFTLAKRIRERLPGFGGRLGEAMLLGRSRALLPGERDGFRKSGASHLVAVSGLHVGLVALLASLLLAPAPRLLRAAGVVGSAWTYAGLAAWTPSAVRAATLALGVTLAGLLGRPRSAPLGLALALPWLLWGHPEFAGALGFQLSAAAVAGILVALDVVGAGPPGRFRFLRGSIVASVGAQLGTLPLQIGAFGTVAPLATLPNLVAIPLAGLFLPAALLAVLLPQGPWTGVLVASSATIARTIEVVLLGAAEHLPYMEHVPLPPPAGPWLMAGGAVAWFTLPRLERRRTRTRGLGAGVAILLIGFCFLPRSPIPGPWIAFLDVGQGDAAVLHLSDDSTWVIDTGDDRGPGDGARRAVLPFLRRQGIRRVQGMVISHRHRDHVGALPSLLAGIEVERVYDAGYGGRGGTSGRVDSLLADYRRWPCLVASGDTLHGTGKTHIVALGPPRGDPTGPPPGHNLNDASLVLRVVDGPFHVVLAGDAELVGETASLAGSGSISAPVLKVGHHGSATSSSEAFLHAVAPNWAVVSCGEGNRFGHPNAGILARLERTGAHVLRTDRDGAVWIRCRNGEWEVRTHPPLPHLGMAEQPPSLPSVVGTRTP